MNEIIKHICQSKKAFNSNRALLDSKNISLKIRKKYWRPGQYQWKKKRLEAFKMWGYRRMMKISWNG